MGQVIAQRELVAIRNRHSDMRIVLTNGCFDLLHLGHVRYLQHARSLGDLLLVGVNSDASTRRLKGPARPIVPQDSRAEVLAALACVDYVVIFDEDTADALIQQVHPALYVKGGDYGATTARSEDVRIHAVDIMAAHATQSGVDPAVHAVLARLPEARTAAAAGADVVLVRYLAGHSTTDLIERIRNLPAGADGD